METKHNKIQQAYDSLIVDLQEYPYLEQRANDLLDDLHKLVELWDGSPDISFLEPFYFGTGKHNGSNAVSAEGQAIGTRANFIMFMDDETTKQKFRELLLIRKQHQLDYTISKKVLDVGILDHLRNFSFPSGDRPWLYTHRMIVMLFIEVFTAIVDYSQLVKTGTLLEKKDSNIPFEKLQYQIRESITGFLSQRKEKRSKFFEAAIAWWIVEANRPKQKMR